MGGKGGVFLAIPHNLHYHGEPKFPFVERISEKQVRIAMIIRIIVFENTCTGLSKVAGVDENEFRRVRSASGKKPPSDGAARRQVASQSAGLPMNVRDVSPFYCIWYCEGSALCRVWCSPYYCRFCTSQAAGVGSPTTSGLWIACNGEEGPTTILYIDSNPPTGD